MIVIKGNLIIDKLRTEPLLRQAQNRASSETSSEQINTENIVAFADLDIYDITNATILIGDVAILYLNNTELVLVTEDVLSYEC